MTTFEEINEALDKLNATLDIYISHTVQNAIVLEDVKVTMLRVKQLLFNIRNQQGKDVKKK